MNRKLLTCINVLSSRVAAKRVLSRNVVNRARRFSSNDYQHSGESGNSGCATASLGNLLIAGGGCLLAYTIYNERGRLLDCLNLGTYNNILPVAHCSPSGEKNEDSNKAKKSLMYNFIADAAESCSPGVVFIEVTSSRGRQSSLFHHHGPTSCGSGFFVSEDGLILTNAHVVDDSRTVSITMPDGKKYGGTIIDTDPMTDLAVIRVNGSKDEVFPFLQLGASASVRAGEWVAALGSPLQLSNTITSGIVSSIQRAAGELGLPNSDMQYIQTDAAINVGNSGGPLINLDGEVIGINSITVQAVSGISFAIPIDVAKDFLQTVKQRAENGQKVPSTKAKPYQRFFIGITMLTLTPSLIEELHQRSSDYSQVSGGVLVARVAPRSPAERAGLMSGDVVVSINGESVESAGEVHKAVLQGKPLNIQVQRGHSLVALAIHPQPIARM